MAIRDRLDEWENEIRSHLEEELLPFWLDRCVDLESGGYISHFDEFGNDSGEDEKSLIAQTRIVLSMSLAHMADHGRGRCLKVADHGVRFLKDRMWDSEHGGFYWTTDRSGSVAIDKKIVYGHSFAIYALATYAAATAADRGEPDTVAVDLANRSFDLLQIHASDTHFGGYFEMFDRDWTVSGPGTGGGDRKTLDVHMHLMEAFTALYKTTRLGLHRRKLVEIIDLISERILHPEYRTGIPQFYADFSIAEQIKFDIVWGWDRFAEGGVKAHAADNTSAGHNAEFAWLLLDAVDTLDLEEAEALDYVELARINFDHAMTNGIDRTFGGVFVEGPHSGGVYDSEKEFWQQAEVMIGMLEAKLRFGDKRYLEGYEAVHRFVFDRGINRRVGEWWPLLTREGEPIWRHSSHSWKVCYHTIRCEVECIRRLERLRIAANPKH